MGLNLSAKGNGCHVVAAMSQLGLANSEATAIK
jgi:hypothetical protein